MLHYIFPLSQLKVMDEAIKAKDYTVRLLSWMSWQSSSSLTRRHPQYEPAASPATRFSGSGQGRQRARPSSLLTTHSTVRPERKERGGQIRESCFLWRSMATVWLSCLFLLPLSISIGVLNGHPWLWLLFFCLFGRNCGAGWGRGGAGPRVLRGELRLAPEGVSVLGRWRCVAATQGDQQRRCIVSGNPLIGLQRRLWAGRVWVEVYLKKIRLWGQKNRQFYIYIYIVLYDISIYNFFYTRLFKKSDTVQLFLPFVVQSLK